MNEDSVGAGWLLGHWRQMWRVVADVRLTGAGQDGETSVRARIEPEACPAMHALAPRHAENRA